MDFDHVIFRILINQDALIALRLFDSGKSMGEYPDAEFWPRERKVLFQRRVWKLVRSRASSNFQYLIMEDYFKKYVLSCNSIIRRDVHSRFQL
jgi:hypothetical protein